MNIGHSYKLFPLGDTAITIDFGNIIDEKINEKVIAVFQHLQKNKFPGMTELIPAYSSLTVCYDLLYLKQRINEKTVLDWVKKEIQQLLTTDIESLKTVSRLIRMPVCYDKEFAPDLESFAKAKNMEPEELVRIHVSKTYRVYLIGFLPGFSYLGEVDPAIETPRKKQPVPVSAGSVGIAGKQTGIYPLDSPGGWQIIGRTPLKLFEKNKDEGVLLKAGDNVRFYAVSRSEFVEIQNSQ